MGAATTPWGCYEQAKPPERLRELKNRKISGREEKRLHGRARYAQEAATHSPKASVFHENSRMSPRNGISFTAEWGSALL